MDYLALHPPLTATRADAEEITCQIRATYEPSLNHVASGYRDALGLFAATQFFGCDDQIEEGF